MESTFTGKLKTSGVFEKTVKEFQMQKKILAATAAVFSYSFIFTVLFPVVSSLPLGFDMIVISSAAVIPSVLFLLFFGRNSGIEPDRPSLAMLCFLFSADFLMNLFSPFLGTPIEWLAGLGGFVAVAPVETKDFSFLGLLYVCIVGPIYEEIVYRKVLAGSLRGLGKVKALVFSALVFGLMHHDLYQGISAFFGAFVYGYVFFRYSLVFSILLHVANNSLATVISYLHDVGDYGNFAIVLISFVLAVVFVVGLAGIVKNLRKSGRTAPVEAQVPVSGSAFIQLLPVMLLVFYEAVMTFLESFSRVV